MINIEMDMRTAAAVRQSLFTDTRDYTYEVKYCPQRVLDIRSVIISIDNQIEEKLKEEESISKLEAEASDYGVGK